MNQENANRKIAVSGKAAKSGNTISLVLAILALVLFAVVVFMQYSEMSYFKDWSL